MRMSSWGTEWCEQTSTHTITGYVLIVTSCILNMLIGPVAQWIRHRPTEPGIAGSSPAGVIHVLKKAGAHP